MVSNPVVVAAAVLKSSENNTVPSAGGTVHCNSDLHIEIRIEPNGYVECTELALEHVHYKQGGRRANAGKRIDAYLCASAAPHRLRNIKTQYEPIEFIFQD